MSGGISPSIIKIWIATRGNIRYESLCNVLQCFPSREVDMPFEVIRRGIATKKAHIHQNLYQL
jgi:hypothetical protein